MSAIISVASKPTLAGCNPEAADLCNPRGEIHRDVYFVTARLGGFEYSHFYQFASEVAAWKFAETVRNAPANWTPKDSQHWTSRKIYGSDSWSEDDEIRLMDEAEQERYFLGAR